MRKYILLLAILIVGMLIGMGISRTYYVQREMDVQRDTIFVHDTIAYTKQVLAERTKIVHRKDTEYVYVRLTDTIYRDGVRYVTLPRQHYRTRVKEAEIFHSGIESRIDSLNIFTTTANITETKFAKEKKHSFTLYGSVGWIDRLRLPVGGKYLYSVYPWWKVGGKVEHDFAQSITGVYATTEFTISW